MRHDDPDLGLNAIDPLAHQMQSPVPQIIIIIFFSDDAAIYTHIIHSNADFFLFDISTHSILRILYAMHLLVFYYYYTIVYTSIGVGPYIKNYNKHLSKTLRVVCMHIKNRIIKTMNFYLFDSYRLCISAPRDYCAVRPRPGRAAVDFETTWTCSSIRWWSKLPNRIYIDTNAKNGSVTHFVTDRTINHK